MMAYLVLAWLFAWHFAISIWEWLGDRKTNL